MYRTTGPVVEPAADRARGELPLRLTRVARREFTGGTAQTDVPLLHRYYSDLAALHGVEHHPDVLVASAGNAFGVMAGAVLEDVVAPGTPAGLVIVAHVLPDLDPRFSPGARLSGSVAGSPLVFALSGTDGTVAFTALRVAGAYARRHGYRRAVVLVVDQSTLPYRTGVEPGGDAAVALLLEDAPGAEVTVGRVPDVAPHGVPSDIAGDRTKVVHVGESGGFPATGAWSGLDLDGHTSLVHHARGDLHYCSIGRS